MKAIDSNAVFTVCNVKYLDKAFVLAESLSNFNDINLDIFLFDKKRDLNINPDFCNIHWIEDLDIPGFKSLSFKYDVIELTTSLKGWISLNLLKYNSKVVFLDPDVMVFNSLEVIFDELDSHPVILTPHYFYPKINNLVDDAALMRNGQYNLGFFAVNSSEESKSFLTWWSERCRALGFIDTQGGLMNDQKWVSIAPMFFPFIHVSLNPGLNVSFWNLDEREVSHNTDGHYVINGSYKLIFFHFSSFNSSNPESLSNSTFILGNNSASKISKLANFYYINLSKYLNISESTTYSYDYMTNGNYISPTLRRAYAARLKEFSTDVDPFDGNGAVATFAKKNNLFQKSNKRFMLEGYNTYANHSRKFTIVYFLMRLLLKIIGPNNFMNFSRLLVYLSRYHNVKDMWKN